MLQHINIGGFTIHSYGLIVAIAILLGLGVAYGLSGKDKEYRNHLMDVITYGLLGAIIGARMWQVFFYDWEYYSDNLIQVFMIWKGGLSIQGGIFGAVLAGIIYTRVKKLDFWRLADIAAPGLIFGQGVGRIACFLNGDAFGKPTGSDFGLVYPPGTYAYQVYGNQPLWPAEVWEGQLNFVIFAVILMLSRWEKVPRGMVFLSYVVLYSLNRFALEFFRGDGSQYLFGFTSGQWTSIAMIVVSLAAGMFMIVRSNRSLV